jgi:pimeloyl-ACP methyl ester carboxylesterase
MDYYATGDSSGDGDDPDRVPSWSRSVDEGLYVLRRTGTTSLLVIGMRLGATLGGLAATRDGQIDGLVLWDPVTSGRAYLAEQRALNAFSSRSLMARADDLVETPGMIFTPKAAADLRKLDLSKEPGPLAKRVLVLSRSDRGRGPLAARFDLPHVEWGEATGQADLLEAGAAYGAIAYESVDRVAQWASAIAPPTASPIEPPAQAESAVIAKTPSGDCIREIPMFVGKTGLFGVLTEVPGRGPGPTVLFLNTANGNHTGIDRLWVELARRWATAGLRCFRLDLSGLGDSPTRHKSQARFVSRAPEAFDDVIEACTALEPEDPSNIVLVGFSTSGYQVLESALQVKPRGVVAFCPAVSFRPPETLHGGRVDSRRRIALPRKAPIGKYYSAHYRTPFPSGELPRYSNLGRFARAVAAPRTRSMRWLRDSQRALVTQITWRVRMLSKPSCRPVRWLSELADSAVDVLIVSSKHDARPLQLGVHRRLLDKWHDSGLRFLYISDHLLRVPEERVPVTQAVTEHVLDRFAPPTTSLSQPSTTLLPVAPRHAVPR